MAATAVAAGLLAPSALATNVTVRIEGIQYRSVMGVNTTGAGVPGNAACLPNSAGEALNLASQGDWDHLSVPVTIRGETHDYSARDYWAFWVNGTYRQATGICNYVVQPGDEIMLSRQVDDAAGLGTVWPLYFDAPPTTVEAGRPYTATVIERVVDAAGATSSRPAVGATVGDGVTSALTDAAGVAALTAPAAVGSFRLRASKSGDIPPLAPFVRVIPYVPPVPPVPPAPPVVPVVPVVPSEPSSPGESAGGGAESPPEEPESPPAEASAGSQAALRALIARIAGVHSRQHFPARRAPRILRGSATGGTAVKTIELRLRQKVGRDTCAGYDAGTKTLSQLRCSRGARWFAIPARSAWSYRLPSRLPAGLYQLQVRATDASGARSPVHSLRFRVR